MAKRTQKRSTSGRLAKQMKDLSAGPKATNVKGGADRVGEWLSPHVRQVR